MLEVREGGNGTHRHPTFLPTPPREITGWTVVNGDSSKQLFTLHVDNYSHSPQKTPLSPLNIAPDSLYLFSMDISRPVESHSGAGKHYRGALAQPRFV